MENKSQYAPHSGFVAYSSIEWDDIKKDFDASICHSQPISNPDSIDAETSIELISAVYAQYTKTIDSSSMDKESKARALEELGAYYNDVKKQIGETLQFQYDNFMQSCGVDEKQKISLLL